MRWVSESHRYFRRGFWLASDDVEPSFLFASVPPPVLRGLECPASPSISFSGLWQASGRPEQRASRMFEHSTPDTHHADGPQCQLALAWTGICHVPQDTPCAARGMRHDACSSRPFQRVPIRVPHVHSGQCFIDRIPASEEHRNGLTVQIIHARRESAAIWSQARAWII